MKSPKRNLKARSSVSSRKSSPGWTAATDLFKSPKSPSPVRRVTRRTSVYQSKKTVESQFKMPPISKVKSPPGVKTRARRSSIYQKGGGRLLSPKNTRARRASMYVSSKTKTETVDVFSKVWATPICPPTLAETSPEKVESKKASSSKKPAVKQQSPEKPEPVAQQATVISPQQKVGKTPRSTKKPAAKKQSPVKSAKKSPKLTAKNPSPVKSAKKSPKPSAKNPSPAKSAKKSPKPSAKKPPLAKSAKKSPKMSSPKKSSPKKSSLKKAIITSTPTKSVEELTGKSFYSTPGETPIANKRTDDVFVFSAMPVKSAKKSTRARKSVVLTPLDTPKKDTSKTPKRMPVRKTPAVKRSRENESDSSMTSPAVPSPVAKRLRASAKTRSVKTAKRSVKQLPSSTKVPLSPSQMIDVLKSTKRVDKRPASTSPTSRPSKMAKTDQELTTPRVFKTVKRSSPKKLADIVSVSQNTNNNSEDVAQSPTGYTSLNDTINTDSRSGRCVIL